MVSSNRFPGSLRGSAGRFLTVLLAWRLCALAFHTRSSPFIGRVRIWPGPRHVPDANAKSQGRQAAKIQQGNGTERGCVEDQPQRVGSSKGSGACRVLRLIEDDTAALRSQATDACERKDRSGEGTFFPAGFTFGLTPMVQDPNADGPRPQRSASDT